MGVVGGIFTIQPKVKQKGWGDGNAFVMNRGGGGGPFGNVVAAKVCTKMNFPTSRKRDRRDKKKKKNLKWRDKSSIKLDHINENESPIGYSHVKIEFEIR